MVSHVFFLLNQLSAETTTSSGGHDKTERPSPSWSSRSGGIFLRTRYLVGGFSPPIWKMRTITLDHETAIFGVKIKRCLSCHHLVMYAYVTFAMINGKLVVWIGGLGFESVLLSKIPFHKRIPGIQTTGPQNHQFTITFRWWFQKITLTIWPYIQLQKRLRQKIMDWIYKHVLLPNGVNFMVRTSNFLWGSQEQEMRWATRQWILSIKSSWRGLMTGSLFHGLLNNSHITG